MDNTSLLRAHLEGNFLLIRESQGYILKSRVHVSPKGTISALLGRPERKGVLGKAALKSNPGLCAVCVPCLLTGTCDCLMTCWRAGLGSRQGQRVTARYTTGSRKKKTVCLRLWHTFCTLPISDLKHYKTLKACEHAR